MLFFSASCAHLKSGKYVVLTKNYTTKELSKLFNVGEWKLKEMNKGKNFTKGEKIFLPFSFGVLGRNLNSRSVASVNIRELVTSKRFLWPVPSSKKISSHFGHRWGRKHEGMDIPARKGARIVAVDSGVVVYSGRELGGYGNITVIAHKDGFFSVYAHASKNYTRKGQKVSRGQVIAEVGSTGRSTGNHLHFEIRRDSKAFNPYEFYADN